MADKSAESAEQAGRTPGPWRLVRPRQRPGVVTGDLRIEAVDGHYVATIRRGASRHISFEEHEANGHTLAAADELLVALKRQADWVRAALECKTWAWDGDQRDAAEIEHAQALAVIAKAEGRS
jgi:hypothetical protein